MKKQKYSPILCSPYYSDNRQQGAVLHRYLDDQFLNRFTNQAQANQLAQDTHHWLDEDRFSGHHNPSLRLTIHRTFYVICCEACCDAPGQPALDASRIESAGFVIRQQLDGQHLRWMISDGLDKGWDSGQNMSTDEPDEYRYLLNKGYTEARSPEPAYSGEQTYPLSPLLVEDGLSKPTRKHNLLFGFLSLGGQSYPSISPSQPELSDVLNELSWPFGTFAKPATAWVENHGEHSGHLIQDGDLQPATAEFLALLFERFHILDTTINENSELIALLENIKTHLGTSSYHLPHHFTQSESLFHYLQTHQQSIENWLTEYHAADDDSAAANSKNFLQNNLQLFISETQAKDLQLIIARRSLGVIELALSDLPEPRYERDGLYYAKVFLRYRDAKGCTKIIWGPDSVLFHVAAPFDPEASRPLLIQMPGMDDLKRGLASGAAMRLPKSLADVVEKIKPDLGEPGLSSKNNRNDGGWIYIFSIPILTICAMILLMILVSLLNFIFRWIPWVIQRIPIPK